MEEGEEEAEREDDEIVEPEVEKRCYGKARKFARMVKKGLIPEEIVAMYNDAGAKHKQPRLFRTELVNRLFKKTQGGDYVLCHDSPEFASWKSNTDQSWATQKTEGVAYSIMLWNTFHGSVEGFQDAQARGDIYQCNNMWFFNKVSAGRTKASTDSMQLQSGKVSLDTETYASFNSFLSSRNWAKYGQDMDLQDQKPGTLVRQKSQLALGDASCLQVQPAKELYSAASTSAAPVLPKAAKPVPKLTWKSLEKHVLEAKGANERLQRDCSRLVLKVRGNDTNLENEVKAVMDKLQENLTALSQCQMWNEVPDSNGNEKHAVETFFQQVASRTEEINEGMEKVKGVCRARGL